MNDSSSIRVVGTECLRLLLMATVAVLGKTEKYDYRGLKLKTFLKVKLVFNKTRFIKRKLTHSQLPHSSMKQIL